MNSYYSGYSGSGAKWVVCLVAFLILMGGVVLLAASGNFGPKADADAQRIQAQTQTQTALDALQLQQQKELNALQVEQQKQLNQQELEQHQIAFERWQTFLQVIIWVLVLGVVLAGLVAAGAFATRQIVAARALRAEAEKRGQGLAVRLRVQELESRLAELSGELQAHNHDTTQGDWQTLSKRIARMEKQVTRLRMRRFQHNESNYQSASSKTSGNGHNLPKAV